MHSSTTKKEKSLPVVPIDKSLNKYRNTILFPEKYEKAKKAFEKFGFPKPEDFNR